MIRFSHKGDFKKTDNYLKRIKQITAKKKLEEYAMKGVDALQFYTPKDTGKTAASWKYEINYTDSMVEIIWSNTNIVDGWANVAILIQYGHATRNGGYVKGVDYINPAMQPIFEEMLYDIWNEVASI